MKKSAATLLAQRWRKIDFLPTTLNPVSWRARAPLQIQRKYYSEEKPELALTSAEPVADTPAGLDQESPTSTKRMSWARLLKRVFNIDISICSRCAGKIKIIAAIEDPKVIKQILEHLSLAWAAPRLMQARGPPQTEQNDFFAQEFFED